MLSENHVIKFFFCVNILSWIFAVPLAIFVEQPCIALKNWLKGRPMHAGDDPGHDEDEDEVHLDAHLLGAELKSKGLEN